MLYSIITKLTHTLHYTVFAYVYMCISMFSLCMVMIFMRCLNIIIGSWMSFVYLGTSYFLSSFYSCVHSAQFCEDVRPSTWWKQKTTWIGKEKSRKGCSKWEVHDGFSEKAVWKLGTDTYQKWDLQMIKCRVHHILPIQSGPVLLQTTPLPTMVEGPLQASWGTH